MLTSILCMLNSNITNQNLLNQTNFNAQASKLNSNFNNISNEAEETFDMIWEVFEKKCKKTHERY